MFNPDEFFARQLADWRLCAGRYEELRHAKRREITLHGRSYILIHNPLRAVSATAKVENGNVAPRPCFLCRAARPGEQRDFVLTPPDSGNRYRVAVNPFPILSHHFTIISERHCRQTITPERLRDMQYIARQMAGYLVFFNGAAAGASAPDHLHFQAVRQTDVPLTASANPFAERLFIQNCDAERVKIDCAESDDVNVLCWFSGGETHWTVARRRCHRPRRYFAEGAEHILISPAALEYAGVVPLAREEDYAKMTAERLDEVVRECFNSEPIVDVGR
ncbi:MAG: DUF4922 domain-containing protein, partial [Prevotella sp.]|nr:DUF4922 domain-containing protein [Prevotella sp.]